MHDTSTITAEERFLPWEPRRLPQVAVAPRTGEPTFAPRAPLAEEQWNDQDPVDLQSQDSFPASDPPSWTGVSI